MLRRLSTILSGVSLVLAAVFAAASFRQPVGYSIVHAFGPERPYTSKEALSFQLPPATFDFGGFRIQRSYRLEYTYRDVWVFTIPYWFLSALCCVAPGLWMRGF